MQRYFDFPAINIYPSVAGVYHKITIIGFTPHSREYIIGALFLTLSYYYDYIILTTTSSCPFWRWRILHTKIGR